MNYKLIDTLTGIFSGACIAFFTCQLVPHDWNMLSGMLLGMAIGMVLHLVLMFLLVPFFGAFEVMVPLHIIGMIVGMAGGMATTMNISTYWITWAGGVTGWIVAVGIQYSNKKLVSHVR